ncbi:HSP20-like chaperone [Macroventuria anomochaeta]|uniref:HSP20-like chaperone n=1 Tax=Macroventuria anomochaeta TaxID=301207 RepID=A0ACB6RSI8_9PLEO|nr:HSP20-like chaperone [Macroventuria anomochaeta]KAF2624355.1 HSP20-like chaperone [Macroventuria anomochaeta]
MQSLRTTIRRVPQQLNRTTKPSTARTFTTTPAIMSLFPRFTQEYAPIFRLFDEYDRQAFGDVDRQFTNSIRSFTPKFDVKETKEAYELHGELPGVDQKNINIEWTDNNTLTIAGKHEHVREEGQRPTAMENGEEQKKLESNVKDEKHQPTVEDESAESTNKDTQVAKQSEQHEVAKKEEPKHKYWVSERSVGSFHRSFAFPARVDQDAVKASLKNGILSIVVPKATAPQSRKVNIE